MCLEITWIPSFKFENLKVYLGKGELYCYVHFLHVKIAVAIIFISFFRYIYIFPTKVSSSGPMNPRSYLVGWVTASVRGTMSTLRRWFSHSICPSLWCWSPCGQWGWREGDVGAIGAEKERGGIEENNIQRICQGLSSHLYGSYFFNPGPVMQVNPINHIQQ